MTERSSYGKLFVKLERFSSEHLWQMIQITAVLGDKYMEKEKNSPERLALTERLVRELPILRTKLGVSQDQLAGLIGITRQTYSTFETGKRRMPWSICLALLLIFDNDERTHQYLRGAGLFPDWIVRGRMSERKSLPLTSLLSLEGEDVLSRLDEQAIHAIETVILMEYARCEQLSGDAVIKAFDGRHIVLPSRRTEQAQRALDSIRRGKKAETVDS